MQGLWGDTDCLGAQTCGGYEEGLCANFGADNDGGDAECDRGGEVIGGRIDGNGLGDSKFLPPFILSSHGENRPVSEVVPLQEN